MLTKSEEYLLAVLNIGKSQYINIKPDKIHISEIFSNDKQKKGMPPEFEFMIIDDDNSINININMKAIEVVHHVKSPIINYWRVHVKTTGYINFENQNEKIERVQMIEYVKIR